MTQLVPQARHRLVNVSRLGPSEHMVGVGVTSNSGQVCNEVKFSKNKVCVTGLAVSADTEESHSCWTKVTTDLLTSTFGLRHIRI